MARSNRPRGSKRASEVPEELRLDLIRTGGKRSEIRRGVEYTVQSSNGGSAEDGKTWLCPHCNILIHKGLVHSVAWDAVRGVTTRRHFHNACWVSFQGPLL